MQFRHGGDDTSGIGMGLHEPSSAAADQFRVATAWDDSAGSATVDTLGVAWSAADVLEYYLRNDPTPFEFNDAINRVLSETERVVETVLPTVEGSRTYPLLNAPWIETRNDVLSVLHRHSPNMLDNSNFELWGRGADAQLHAWVLSGTSSTVTRVDGTYERFAARITRSSNDATFQQTIPIPIPQLYSKVVTLFGRAKTATADMHQFQIFDGSETVGSDRHSGDDTWSEFTLSKTIAADAKGPLRVNTVVQTSDGSVDIENLVLVEGDSVPDWLSKYGDQYARTDPIAANLQMRGSLPVIVTDRTYGRGSQIVVQSKQQYFELTADSSTGGVTDMPFEAIVAGTIVKLAETQIGKPNAARWLALAGRWQPTYRSWQRQLIEPSVNPTKARQTVRSA